MPRKKTKSTKLPKVHEMIDTKTEDLLPEPASTKRKFPLLKPAIVVLAIGLIAILYTNKGLLIAATVNGRPIYRWELNKALSDQFGSQTLEMMISKSLVTQEAQKAGVSVTQSDVEAKEKAVVGSLGENVSLDDVLKYQGMTKSEFEDQIRLQLTVEKLLGKDIVITDADVDNYIATNSATLVATDEAGLKKEAREAILSQKINEKLQPWFTALKANAKISRFL